MAYFVLMLSAVLILVLAALMLVAARRQAAVTASIPAEAQAVDRQVFRRSSEIVEATVAEQLAEKARDPRLASMTQEDLVYEVLKDCYDPEIPLNIVDLGLVVGVQVDSRSNASVTLTMTSPACPSHVSISEDVKTKLTDAGFENPKVDVVWEPSWTPERISDAGRKKLGLN